MSYIVDLLKSKYLDKVPTTKELVYKYEFIKVSRISEEYEKLVNQSKATKIPKLNFSGNSYFYNSMGMEWMQKLSLMNIALTKAVKKEFIASPSEIIMNEVFNSLWIEGIKSSKKVVKQIFKEKGFDVKDQEQKLILNFKLALEFIYSTKTIDEGNLFALYKILTRDIDMKENTLDGYPYRKEEVQIGKESVKGAHPGAVKQNIDSLFDFMDLVSQIKVSEQVTAEEMYLHLNSLILIHYHFEITHPYYDFNGRMGRLITLWYAKNNNLLDELSYFSEAINLFKTQLYYQAFEKSALNGFKLDVTYFTSSVLSALVAHKICQIGVHKVNNLLKEKYGVRLNAIQSDIVMSLLSKDKDKYYTTQEFILGVEDINVSIVSLALSELVSWGIIKEINTKPKQYKLEWTNDLVKMVNELIEY